MLLLIVHGHVHPIDGSKCRSWGPLWLPVLLEGSTCPLGEAETRRGGSGAFDDAAGARARRRDVARDAYRLRGLSVRLRWDRVRRSCLERLTCYQCFLGPYDGVLANMQGAVSYPLLGTLGILILDTRREGLWIGPYVTEVSISHRNPMQASLPW
jgi:hypothetical protein